MDSYGNLFQAELSRLIHALEVFLCEAALRPAFTEKSIVLKLRPSDSIALARRHHGEAIAAVKGTFHHKSSASFLFLLWHCLPSVVLVPA